MVGSLFVAAGVVSRFGSKTTLVAAQATVATYHGLLLAACALGPTTEEARLLVLSAGALAGLAAAHMWTAQGPYFARAARLYALSRATSSVAETTAWLASFFATTFLTLEVVARCGAATFVLLGFRGTGLYSFLLSLSLLAMCISSCLINVDMYRGGSNGFGLGVVAGGGSSTHPPAQVPAAAGAVKADGEASLVGNCRAAPSSKEPAEAPQPAVDAEGGTTKSRTMPTCCRSVLSTASLLLTDRRAVLLLPTNMAKGLAEAFINDYVNGNLIDEAFGLPAVG